jgi:hypothetical protein
MKVIPETRRVPKFESYILIMHVMSKLSTNIHMDSYHFLSRLSNKDCLFFDLSLGRRGGGVISHLPSYCVIVPNNFSFITIR